MKEQQEKIEFQDRMLKEVTVENDMVSCDGIEL
jgi:hypothetical protein